MNERFILMFSLLSVTFLAAAGVVTIPLDNHDADNISHPRSRHLEGHEERETPNFGFEDLTGWKLSYSGDKWDVKFTRSREEPLWGNYVGRLEVRQTGKNPDPQSRILLTPPDNFMISSDFDSINIWTFGTAFAASPGLSAMLYFEIIDADGEKHLIPMRSSYQNRVFWSGWTIWHKTLDKPLKAPARLNNIVMDGFNHPKTVLYFDSLRFYRQSTIPLPQARVPSWQELGVPNRPETILPTPVNASDSTLVQTGRNQWQFSNGDGLQVRVTPSTGVLDDIEVTYQGKTFKPLTNGGFYWTEGAEKLPPADPAVLARLKAGRMENGRLTLDWIYHVKGRIEPARWVLELRNNSLIIDLSTANGTVAEVKCGGIKNLPGTVIEIPYMNLRNPRKNNEGPGVFCGENIYISSLFDWYNSDASELFSECSSRSGGSWKFVPSEGDTRWFPDSDAAIASKPPEVLLVNGGTAYNPRTDGTRNPVRERLFLTIDKRLAGVLPNIPNPPHRYLRETADVVWVTRMVYENKPRSDLFRRELEMWKNMHAYGAEKLNIRYHGDLYRLYIPRRNGDPISFIQEIEPRIGGDAGLQKLFAGLQSLGYRYGLYTGHTLLSPLSYDVWDEDYLTRNSDGNWVYGSAAYLQVKNTRMRELQQKYNRIFKEKYNPTCSYLDQLTCPPPWRYTDYDIRTPDAGKFSAPYRNFVESLRTEINDFGPVLSEGMSQWLFAGICDNYAQPIRVQLHVLPDFQLRKLHLLSNDCGYHLAVMRNRGTKEPPSKLVYQVLAYTYAYGNTGHLYGCYSGSPLRNIPDYMIRSYFLIQPMQKFFALTPVRDILYNLGERLGTVEDAIKADALKRNQVKIIYENDAETAVNLNEQENFPIRLHDRDFDLPPYGFAFYLPGKALAYSTKIEGGRTDFMQTANLLYCDNHGIRREAGGLTCAEAYIIRAEEQSVRVIPAPFRKAEQIVLDMKNYPQLNPEHPLSVRALDRDGRLLDKQTIPYRGKLELDISSGPFALQLQSLPE